VTWKLAPPGAVQRRQTRDAHSSEIGHTHTEQDFDSLVEIMLIPADTRGVMGFSEYLFRAM